MMTNLSTLGFFINLLKELTFISDSWSDAVPAMFFHFNNWKWHSAPFALLLDAADCVLHCFAKEYELHSLENLCICPVSGVWTHSNQAGRSSVSFSAETDGLDCVVM